MAQAFAQLLRAPHDDAQMIIRERFPVPRLVVCDQHGSQVSIVYQDQFEYYLSSLTVVVFFYWNSSYHDVENFLPVHNIAY